MIQISDDKKLILGALALFALLVGVCLIFGALFGWCDQRKIQKHEANVANAQSNIAEGEKKVSESKANAAEVNGELKIQKQAREEANVEVNEKVQKRREAAANSERVRRSPVRNVNGASLRDILDDADSRR